MDVMGEYLSTKHRPNTKRRYYLVLKQFQEWYNKPLKNMVEKDVFSYWEYLEKKRYTLFGRKHIKGGRKYSDNVIISNLYILKDLLSWMGKSVKELDQQLPKTKWIPKISRLREEDLPKLFTACGNNVRDLCILRVFADTGVRVGEICSINTHDVNIRKRCMKVPFERKTGRVKGKEPRTVFFSKRTELVLKRYLNTPRMKGKHGKGKLFTVTPSFIRPMIKIYAQMASLGYDISPHDFRHFFARAYLKRDSTPEALVNLSHLLGHSNILTTAPYTLPTEEEAVRRYDELFGEGW